MLSFLLVILRQCRRIHIITILLFSLVRPTFSQSNIGIASPEKPKSDDKILAQVNNTPIYLLGFLEQYDMATKGRPYKTITKKDFLEYLIKFELAVQQAQKLGLDKTKLAQESFKSTLHNMLIQKEVVPKLNNIQVTDEDIKKFYEEKGFSNFLQIVIIPTNTTQESENEAKTKAENLRKEVLKNPKLFGELAKRHSHGPAAPAGGDIGNKTRDDLLPELAKEAFALQKEGDITPVIKSFIGYHIFQLKEKKSLSEILKKHSEEIREKAKNHKSTKILEGYYEDLRKGTTVKINSDLLSN